MHKKITIIARKYHSDFVRDLSGKFLQAGNVKSSTDTSIGVSRELLKYKAVRNSGHFYDEYDNSFTVTCSTCHKRKDPSGLRVLGGREGFCSECHAHRGCDVKAAMNIRQFDRELIRATKVA